MKNKVSPRVEKVFARAVALEQTGRMRNTIFCVKNRVYILNFDHTVLIRFLLPRTEKPFSSPVAFRANDYDSNLFYEKDGKIVFETHSGGYVRTKTCMVPDRTPEDVENIWKELSAEERSGEEGTWFPIPKNLVNLLEEGLSHIEFVGEKGKPVKIIQRDIYAGAKIEIQEDGKALLGNRLPFNFGPVAIRTQDLLALISFNDVVSIRFVSKEGGADFLRFKNQTPQLSVEGFLGCCLYDEMYEVKTLKEDDHGREKPKNRRSEQKIDSKIKRRKRNQ